jgi:pimeloyl-ACP methyl ester carboxylesterase
VAARTPAFVLTGVFSAQEFFLRHWPDAALRVAVKRLPEPDAALFERPAVRDAFMQDLRSPSGTTAQAAAQDFALFVRDWGFRLQDVSVPTHVWHGDVDKNVPYSHGVFMAQRIPGAEFHACPGEGHLLVVDHLEEILRTVSGGS